MQCFAKLNGWVHRRCSSASRFSLLFRTILRCNEINFVFLLIFLFVCLFVAVIVVGCLLRADWIGWSGIAARIGERPNIWLSNSKNWWKQVSDTHAIHHLTSTHRNWLNFIIFAYIRCDAVAHFDFGQWNFDGAAGSFTLIFFRQIHFWLDSLMKR